MLVPSPIADDPCVLSLATLHVLTLSKFHRNACNFQLEFGQAVLEGKKNVLLQTGRGMGKTLGFWITLLVRISSFVIVVMPRTLPSDRHVEDLMEAGITAINIHADTVSSCPHIFGECVPPQAPRTQHPFGHIVWGTGRRSLQAPL